MCALAVVLMVGGVLFGGVLSAVVVFAVEVVVVTSPLRIRGTRPFHPGFLWSSPLRHHHICIP